MSKTIEIPLDVAKRWVDGCPKVEGGPYYFESDKEMKAAIEKALPPSREERLGLPWTERSEGFVAAGDGSSVCGLGTRFDSHAQAKLIAAAPKLAELLGRVMNGDSSRLPYVEMLALLRECGWLDE